MIRLNELNHIGCHWPLRHPFKIRLWDICNQLILGMQKIQILASKGKLATNLYSTFWCKNQSYTALRKTQLLFNSKVWILEEFQSHLFFAAGKSDICQQTNDHQIFSIMYSCREKADDHEILKNSGQENSRLRYRDEMKNCT